MPLVEAPGARRAPAGPVLIGLINNMIDPALEATESQLGAAGYTLVSSSPESGADLFVKPGRSLLACCQGHPEYEDTTLLKEYRRDVRATSAGEQAA